MILIDYFFLDLNKTNGLFISFAYLMTERDKETERWKKWENVRATVWLTDRSRPSNWSIEWLPNWPTDRKIDWWLTDWLTKMFAWLSVWWAWWINCASFSNILTNAAVQVFWKLGTNIFSNLHSNGFFIGFIWDFWQKNVRFYSVQRRLIPKLVK